MCFWCHIQNILAMTNVKEFYPVFSSSFMVSGLIFKSLIHFELFFVIGIRQGSAFILICMNIQFFQHHWLERDYQIFLAPFKGKKLSFPYWAFFTPLSILVDYISKGYIWALASVPLTCVSILFCLHRVGCRNLVPWPGIELLPPQWKYQTLALDHQGIPCVSIFILIYNFDYCSFVVVFEIRKYDVSFFVILSNSYSHLESFMAPYIFRIFFYFSEKCLWNFDVVAMNP